MHRYTRSSLSVSARWPPHLPTTKNMDVQVVHRLATLLAIVDYDPEPFVQLLLLSNRLCRV